MLYFPTRLTDGYTGHMSSKEAYPEATFFRASPCSKKAQKFEMDETNVEAMIEAIEEERINEPKYYHQILDMAALTLLADELKKETMQPKQWNMIKTTMLRILCP